MRSQTLGQTGITTSALGFGCVRLTSHPSRAEAVRLLEHAFDCGITHFDIARAYGFGRAEGILGEFLRGKRQRVTVATKLGLQPPGGAAGNRWLIDAAKKVLSPFPSLLQRARRHGAAATTEDFSPQAAIQSLHTSLRELHTGYVDLLLLHEAALADAANADLLDALQKEISAGTVRALGIASDFRKLEKDAASLPPAYKILQFNDNTMERNICTLANCGGRSSITHSIFKPASQIRESAKVQPGVVKDFSTKIDTDLNDPAVIGSLLLHYALHSNPSGVVLFSSMNPDRIAANVRAAGSPAWDEIQLAHFQQFVDAIVSAGQPQPTNAATVNAS